MPPRASHLPTSAERDALQKLRAGRELTPRALEPTGKRTVLNMVSKGWIERGSTAATYRITTAGLAALLVKLPQSGKPDLYLFRQEPSCAPPLLKLLQAFPGGLELQQRPPRAPREGRFAARHQWTRLGASCLR